MECMSRNNSHGGTAPELDRNPVHPLLLAQLAEAGLDLEQPPSTAEWQSFLASVERRYQLLDELEKGTVDLERGWASFENLFRASPIPTMEQDYTAVLEWMNGLRAAGVTDIVEYLGDDIERFRHPASLIRMVAANPAAVRVIGLAENDLLGPLDPAIVNEGALDGWRNQFDAVWRGIALSEATFQGETASGRVYDAHSTLSAPVVEGRPDFSRAVLTIVDISAQRNEERRMKATIDAKNQFLASISHEIRTPLTAVLGFARLLLDAGDEMSVGDRHEMLRAVLEQAADVTNLVEDLLVAARAEIGRLTIVDGPLDVAAELTQTIEAGGSFTRGVAVGACPAGVHAMGDPARVRQILRNLLTNAERYGGPDVRVDVTVEDDRVVVAVSDDGAGLDTDEWERIFEPYHRAHETPGQPSAVGIGLAICRQLADLMDAILDYRYEGGRSVFRLGLRRAA